MLDVRVGESGDILVRAEKALQQAERRIQSHRKSRKSERRGKSRDNDDEVINAESTRSLRGKEEIVQNIQMIVEKQCQRTRRLRYTSCSFHVSWRMCSRAAMTSAWNSEVENTKERIPHRSSTLTRAILSRVVRTSACDSVVQEDWSSRWYRRYPNTH